MNLTQQRLEEIIIARNRVVQDYLLQKGIEKIEDLTLEQVMEIRDLKEWKEAVV